MSDYYYLTDPKAHIKTTYISPGTKAKELFLIHLNKSQRESFLESLSFVVVTNKNHKYRIDARTYIMNIYRIDGFFIIKRQFCISLDPSENHFFPYFDHILAQKILLETNEAHFLKIANRTIE